MDEPFSCWKRHPSLSPGTAVGFQKFVSGDCRDQRNCSGSSKNPLIGATGGTKPRKQKLKSTQVGLPPRPPNWQLGNITPCSQVKRVIVSSRALRYTHFVSLRTASTNLSSLISLLTVSGLALSVAVGSVQANSPDSTVHVAVNKAESSTYTDRGIELQHCGQFEKAIANYTRAIDLDPTNATAYFGRGESKWKLKLYRQARADLDEAIRRAPVLSDAFYIRGRTHQALGNDSLAIADFERAVRLNERDIEARNSLAWMLATNFSRQFRNGERAVQHALKACELSGWRDPNTIDTLAAAFAESGDFARAGRYQKQAIAALPADTDLGDEFRKRLGLYERKIPSREPYAY